MDKNRLDSLNKAQLTIFKLEIFEIIELLEVFSKQNNDREFWSSQIQDKYKTFNEKVRKFFRQDSKHLGFYNKWKLVDKNTPLDPDNFRNLLKEKEAILDRFEKEAKVPIVSQIGEVKVIGKYLKCRNIRMPVGGGQKEMLDFLLKNPKKIKNGKILSRGKPIFRTDLEEYGRYENESSFRSSLKKLRGKIKEYELPISIENAGKNFYILVIKMD